MTPWVPKLNGWTLPRLPYLDELAHTSTKSRMERDPSWAALISPSHSTNVLNEDIQESIVAIWSLKMEAKNKCNERLWRKHLTAWLVRPFFNFNLLRCRPLSSQQRHYDLRASSKIESCEAVDYYYRVVLGVGHVPTVWAFKTSHSSRLISPPSPCKKRKVTPSKEEDEEIIDLSSFTPPTLIPFHRSPFDN